MQSDLLNRGQSLHRRWWHRTFGGVLHLAGALTGLGLKLGLGWRGKQLHIKFLLQNISFRIFFCLCAQTQSLGNSRQPTSPHAQ